MKLLINGFILIAVGFLNLQKSYGQGAEQIVQALRLAFQEKNEATVLPYLSSDFTIAGNTDDGAKGILKHIIQGYPIKDIKILSEEKVNGGRKIQIAVDQSTDKKSQTNIYIDTNGKIHYIDLFDQLYGMNRYGAATMRARIPFENKNGSIILSVRINNFARPLRLLFDTGADGMAVSQTLADEIGLTVTRQNNASVVGSNVAIQVSDKNTVLLDTLKLENMGIAIFPKMGHDVDGIIGNTLVKRFIVQVDYDKSELSLFDFGNFKQDLDGISVPLRMSDGMLSLHGDLSFKPGKNHSGDFVFDTGAAYHLICFRPFVRENRLLVNGFKPLYNGSTASLGIVSPTYTGKSYQFTLTGTEPTMGMPVTLMAGSSSNENWLPAFDGSIGVRLMSRYNFVINVQRNEIVLKKNHTYGYPHDFVLGEMLMGWNHQGKLVVLQSLNSAPSSLANGSEIIRIGALKGDNLRDAPQQLASLLQSDETSTIDIDILEEGKIKTHTLSLEKRF